MDVLFLGAAGTVTGSKFLFGCGGRRVLVDCGLFQGFKHLRQRNWQDLPLDPASFDAVVLTHAHIDHSGYLPVLVKRGFKGTVYCTDATRDLCEVLLRDSGRIQGEEAEYANRKGYSKHRPAKPLYDEDDAVQALKLFQPIEYEQGVDLGADVGIRLISAGHILGSSFVELSGEDKRVLVTGDLGRPGSPIIGDPTPVDGADYLLLESTYGRRQHSASDPLDELAEVVGRTVARGGVLIIPSFAVARAQAVLAYLHQLRAAGRIPDVPVYLNSPMATNVTKLYVKHHDHHRLTQEQCAEIFSPVKYVRTVDESKALNRGKGPMIIISSSGMATGGRVIHHLKAFGPDPKNTILFVGFQAGGTRGRRLVEGASEVKIHGRYVPINAEVVTMGGLSAHADHVEALEWLGAFRKPPKRTFLVHGEPGALDTMRTRIEEGLGWDCVVPHYQERCVLD